MQALVIHMLLILVFIHELLTSELATNQPGLHILFAVCADQFHIVYVESIGVQISFLFFP